MTSKFTRRALAGLAAVLVAASAWPQAAAPRYATPPGWQASVADGVVSFTPGTEPADTVQLLLLPARPQQGDFLAQFNAERQALEAQWGLATPQPAAPQSGRVGTVHYAAHYASYDSAGGARYMAFMATGQNGQLAMLVFVAASADAYNRLVPQAAGVLRSLRLGP